MTETTSLTCRCGQVQIETALRPIVSSECFCDSCRTAGARLERLHQAPRLLGPHGGTRFVLYRKDRVRILEGADRLKEFRLTPRSPTRRLVANCCNTPVFLEFRGGHWLSLYGCLWPAGSLPPLELRTMTGDLPDASVLGDEVPHGRWPTLRFYAWLLGAWIAMGFRSPKVEGVEGKLENVPPAPAGT